jgi:hypothetical protein
LLVIVKSQKYWRKYEFYIIDWLSNFLLSLLDKDAGFVYKSFWNETNWVIWNFWSYKTNPWNESLENRPTKRIHDTNLLKKALRIKSAIQIFKVQIRESGFANPPAWIRKDAFHAIVLRICQDSWGFVGFVKTGWIFGSSGHETNPQFKSLRIGLANPDSRICEVGFANLWSRIRRSRNETNLFGVRICDYDTKRIHGFAKQIHVFMNLLYDSCILTLRTSIANAQP